MSENKCVTVEKRLPISKFFGLLVIAAFITVLADAMEFEISRIFLVLTSYRFLFSSGFLKRP